MFLLRQGLYAFHSQRWLSFMGLSDRATLWEFPYDRYDQRYKIAFVGGYDRKIHAMDAYTGEKFQGYIPV